MLEIIVTFITTNSSWLIPSLLTVFAGLIPKKAKVKWAYNLGIKVSTWGRKRLTAPLYEPVEKTLQACVLDWVVSFNEGLNKDDKSK